MPPLIATQNNGFASRQGERQAPNAHDAIVRYSTHKTYITQSLVFVSQAGRGVPPPPPATQNHGFVPQTRFEPKLMIYCDINHLSWISPPAVRQKLEIGQTIDYRLSLSVWDGSGPNIDVSGHMFQPK